LLVQILIGTLIPELIMVLFTSFLGPVEVFIERVSDALLEPLEVLVFVVWILPEGRVLVSSILIEHIIFGLSSSVLQVIFEFLALPDFFGNIFLSAIGKILSSLLGILSQILCLIFDFIPRFIGGVLGLLENRLALALLEFVLLGESCSLSGCKGESSIECLEFPEHLCL
jgi:hypothetical protein